MNRIKPHCSLCLREMLPTDDVILTEMNFLIHECCSSKNGFGEKDRGIFYEVVARHFHIFQGYVEDFNQMRLYNEK